MSGICGIVQLNGKPVLKNDIQLMLDNMKNRGNDAEKIWLVGGIGFGHKMLRTTPESLFENQPLMSEDGNLVLTADARIDNRKELIDQLGIKERSNNEVTDAELIIFSYQKWGEQCPKYLVGDFAFALWDKKEQKLFCVRDHLGIKPFYYYYRNRVLIFASEISVLLSNNMIQKEPDLESIESSLLFDSIPYTRTYFKHINRLKGSTCISYTKNESLVQKEYWNPEDCQKTRNISFEDACTEFLSIFDKAINSRLRSAYPVSFELSGGLDSSAVVTYAKKLESVDRPWHLYSLRFGNMTCDEGKYIDAVCNVVNKKSQSIRTDLIDFEKKYSLKNHYKKYPDWPMDLFFIPHYVLLSQAARQGCRVMLTGQGGDEVLQGSRYMYADFIKHFQLYKYADEFWNSKYKRSDLVNYTLHPLSPAFLRKVKQTFLKREDRNQRKIYQKYLQSVTFNKNFQLMSSAHTAKMIFGTEHSLWADMNGYNFYGRENCEVRHPFFDIRLVQFRLSTPPDFFYRKNTYKALFREAMKGILPEMVRLREDKANFDDIIKMQLKAELKKNTHLQDINDLKIKKLIDPCIWGMFKKYHAKRGFDDHNVFLHWKLLNLEWWYQRNF